MQRREFLKRSAVLSTVTASAVLADGEKDDYKPQANSLEPEFRVKDGKISLTPW